MIKVNCAAIPATLIEAELFGYEKGSFTGAFDRRIGKFEQANGGTIFLDEIGDIPLDLQVKLLCVLQEREIVRLGSNQVIKIDIRIIAATNCNLEKAIAAGRFRLDLYYRLNVFPITMPALRDRKEDIPALSRYFISNLTAKMGRRTKGISAEALRSLTAYDWPGNIRELENIIERSLILNRGDIIEQVELPESQIKEESQPLSDGRIKTIREIERDHIMSTLNYCNGKVSGAGGAAELLDMPANTLFARIKKLGITKDFD
jgi:transcriptional regulator with PAS, ATPase and Fis domain